MTMAPNPIPQRKDVPEEFTWRLEDIFPSEEAWMKEFEAMRGLPAEIAAFHGDPGPERGGSAGLL